MARAILPQLLVWLEDHIDVNRPQVALISNHRDKDSSQEFRLNSVLSGSYTDGYVITLPAAKKILEKNFPIKCPSDTWTFWRQKGWIELYQAYPEGVNQEWNTTEGYVSDVTAAGDVVVDVWKMSVIQRLSWKLKRGIGRLVCYLFLR